MGNPAANANADHIDVDGPHPDINAASINPDPAAAISDINIPNIIADAKDTEASPTLAPHLEELQNPPDYEAPFRTSRSRWTVRPSNGPNPCGPGFIGSCPFHKTRIVGPETAKPGLTIMDSLTTLTTEVVPGTTEVPSYAGGRCRGEDAWPRATPLG